MTGVKTYVLSVFLLSSIYFIQAQEHHPELAESELTHHKVIIMIGHTRVPRGIGGTTPLIIPSWGFNYQYWFSHQWGLGLHNDMEIATYIIKDEEGIEIERERPLIVSLVGHYKPIQLLGFFTGMGREFEKSESFWVYRLGMSLEFEMSNNWELAPELVWDAKEAVYDSWAIGLSVGKRF
jgi:hypothetical protein